MTMDTIFIKNLRIETLIGVYDWEKEQRQEVLFDIHVEVDTSESAISDDIRDAVNYKTITDRVVAFVQSQQFDLVEALAESVASIILAEFATSCVHIQLTKPGVVHGGADVGVRITRTALECLRTAYVGLGSNINAKQNLKKALALLESTFGDLIVSPAYENPAVGFEGDDFINLVVSFDTPFNAYALLDKLRELEISLGREAHVESYTSREIDMDALALSDVVLHAPHFTLPRKCMTKFAFVLKPMADIAGDYTHPELRKTYSQLLGEMTQADAESVAVLKEIEL